MEDKKYALLIDSENISSKYISVIVDEMTKYGTVTYKRIYGDWTTPQSGRWKQELMSFSITPIQQFRNTVGKNATDSTLIIDAMDILYTGNVDGFCIVSSDGDFTRLAGRLRESGMDIIGMGESKTPRSFRAACSVFISLELLLEEQAEVIPEETTGENFVNRVKKGYKNVPGINTDELPDDAKDAGDQAVPDDETAYGDYTDDRQTDILHQSTVERDIIQIITENDDMGRATELGEISARLHKKHSDFDVRNYGYNSLSQFIADSAEFEVKRMGNKCFVSFKANSSLKEMVTEFIVQCVEEGDAAGVDLGFIGQKIHKRFPNFNVKNFGYSTLSGFASVIGSIETYVDEAGRKIVTKKNSG